MKARIYQFFIILLQTVCGGVVAKKEWGFIAELLLIILPFSILGAMLFTLYEHEIKKSNEQSKHNNQRSEV